MSIPDPTPQSSDPARGPVLVATEAVVPPSVSAAGARPEKELIIATRAFTEENKARGWLITFSSLAILAGLTAGAIFSPWWPLRLVFALIEGLTIVRVFCLFHDFQHGAILRQSKFAEFIYFVFGTSILVPPSVWRETHNYHHAHTAKIVGSHIGSYPVVTTAMWKDLTPVQKFGYKAVRSPLNMFLAVFTVFSIGMCIKPVVRAPTKHWGGALSLVWIYGLGVAAFLTDHLDWWIFGWLIPMWLAAMTGAYLFYAQHNFPDGHIASRQDWTFARAATDSSSYMVMGPVMNWFTANIGFHHVHHLNAAIPFYRLPEAMQAIPELQHPGKTSLWPKDVAACFALKVWDPEQNKMVGYPS
ncbi:MAG: fatty acid desaturase [Archangium sp.]|nr:fatty acid desaturase [Archangium sp.]